MLRRFLSKRFLTFCLIGVANTLTDLAILTGLHNLAHWPIIIANTLSTSVALLLSYYLNGRYTFQKARLTRQRLLLYVLITLTGLWILQPIIIFGLMPVLHSLPAGLQLTFLGDNWALVVAKLISVAVTLVWNFVWYSRVVFPGAIDNKPEA